MSVNTREQRPRVPGANRVGWQTMAAALLLVVLCGLVLRLNGLTSYGIWFDEAYHIALVQLPGVPQMLDAVLSNPPSDPLYVLLLRGWVALFGHGDAAVRLLSVLLSAVTLPATYWLGRSMANRAAGLLAALFFALSPYAVELGQEAALYALAALTASLALSAGWGWLSTGRGWELYVALGVVAIYSHYVVAAILLIFVLLAPLGRTDGRRVSTRDWLRANLIVFLAWAPWAAAMAAHWLGAAEPRASLSFTATWASLYNALVQYTAGTSVLHRGPDYIQVPGLVVGALLFGLGAAFGGWAARTTAGIAATIFLLPAAASALTGRWLFVPHFMIFLFPAISVVMATGVLALFAGRRNNQPRTALAASLLLIWFGVQVAGLSAYYRYPPHGNDGLRELAAVLGRDALPADVVLVTPPALEPSLRQYYPGTMLGLPSDFDLREVYLPYEPHDWRSQCLAALDRDVAGRQRFWLVYRPDLDEGGAFLGAVRATYRQVFATPYEFADLYRFEAR